LAKRPGFGEWKQLGFYAQPKDNAFVTPVHAVQREIAETVHGLAWRASTSLDFLLKQGNLERYIASARTLRSKLSEEDHRAIEQLGERIFADLFPPPST